MEACRAYFIPLYVRIEGLWWERGEFAKSLASSILMYPSYVLCSLRRKGDGMDGIE